MLIFIVREAHEGCLRKNCACGLMSAARPPEPQQTLIIKKNK